MSVDPEDPEDTAKVPSLFDNLEQCADDIQLCMVDKVLKLN